MKKLTFALAASAATLAVPASAATFLTVTNSSPEFCTGAEQTCNFTLRGEVDTSGAFSVTSNFFDLPTSGIFGGVATNTATSTTNIDFTGVTLTNTSTGEFFTGSVQNGFFDFALFGPDNVASGLFTLTLVGNSLIDTGSQPSNPSIGGTASFEAVAAAVPEPGTWAMMLIGFGAIGFGMRRRKEKNINKRIRLSYT